MKPALIWIAVAWLRAAAPADCAPCHRAQTRTFAETRMARALTSDIPFNLSARVGPYSYEIAKSVMTVSDGKDTLRVPLAWGFGAGAVGETFVFERAGRWYESRVSYFSALKGLDLTMGMQNITPHNLQEGAGRLMPPAEATRCFNCHATGAGKITAGVQCERCHGSAEAHLKSSTGMRKLGSLTTEEMSDFCGQCHRTWSQVAASGPRGIQNLRFQPYRLANSKCYDAADARIRCTACHDPHRPLETSAAAYDSKCTACHSQRACKVGTRECVTCHMPRLDLPGAHHAFTDHRIRIAKAGEPYPD